MEQREQLFTLEEAAEYLRYHPEHVRRLARRRELQGRKIGHRGGGEWRFTREELDALLSPRVYPKEDGEGTT